MDSNGENIHLNRKEINYTEKKKSFTPKTKKN